MFYIKRGRYYLASGTESHGVQYGVGREWCTVPRDAMAFTTGPEAQEYMLREFKEYERANMDIVWDFRKE